MPRRGTIRKPKNLGVTKSGDRRMKLAAANRLQTLIVTQIIPDYIDERINVDTGRLRNSVRAEEPVITSLAVEQNILIGGVDSVSSFESVYGNAYGDPGVGASRYVDYVAWLNARNKLDRETGELFEDIAQFVKSRT